MLNLTERQARKILADRFNGSTDVSNELWSAVIETLKPKFQPEPVELPDRVRLHGNLLVPEGEAFGWSNEMLSACADAARYRYNAYPGLKRATETLLSQLDKGTSYCGLYLAIEGVKNELAKAPK